jgi:outer membrane biosynthesis protein TonB
MTTPNANELRDHLREWMRKPTEELRVHLHEMGVEVPDLVKSKSAMVKLHADHHASAPLTGSASLGDEAPKPAPARRPAPKAPATKAAPKPATPKAPARKTPAAKPATPKAPARKAPATKAPAAKAPARKAPATKAAPKPATKTTAKANGKAPATEAPATPAANANKHDLARRLIDMVAAEFASETPENKAKLAYWLHGLPTGYPNGGGGGYLRYWPAGLPKPTTSGWRKPE